MSNPYATLDALAQASLVQSGEVSSTELVDAAIAASESVNSQINAIIHERFDKARAEASVVETSLPLAGVPIVVKDLDGTLAGEPCHFGMKHLRDLNYVPSVSSWLFERLSAAGCIIIGKTNTPELGLVPTTEPATAGPTRNPWDLTRSSGGSSGGSAAAVAAGIVALGHAGDGGGSIRIPASECGLVGLKPTRGRVSLGPMETDPWGGLVARLAATHSVRDTAAVLDAVGGPGPGDPFGAPTPKRKFADEVTGTCEKLRIGFTRATSDGTPLDPQVEAATLATAAHLEALGHEVVESGPSQFGDEAFAAELTGAFLSAYTVWIAQGLDEIAELSGSPVTEEGVEPGTWALAEAGRLVDGVTFASATSTLKLLSRSLATWWEGEFDLLLTPTIPELPPTLGQFASTPDNPLNGVFRSSPIVSLCVPFNITGQPAISLPLCQSTEGLPIGMQFVGAFGADDLVLRLASQLEVSMPWADRRPGVWAG